MHKLVNGIKVELTSQEISDRQADEQVWNNGAFDRAMEDLRSKRNAKLDMAIKDLRERRNNKLLETDFYALSDVTMSSEMETYRQELRDITEGLTTVADVEAVVFPTKP